MEQLEGCPLSDSSTGVVLLRHITKLILALKQAEYFQKNWNSTITTQNKSIAFWYEKEFGQSKGKGTKTVMSL
jgi:hypothetical protein